MRLCVGRAVVLAGLVATHSATAGAQISTAQAPAGDKQDVIIITGRAATCADVKDPKEKWSCMFATAPCADAAPTDGRTPYAVLLWLPRDGKGKEDDHVYGRVKSCTGGTPETARFVMKDQGFSHTYKWRELMQRNIYIEGHCDTFVLAKAWLASEYPDRDFPDTRPVPLAKLFDLSVNPVEDTRAGLFIPDQELCR